MTTTTPLRRGIRPRSLVRRSLAASVVLTIVVIISLATAAPARAHVAPSVWTSTDLEITLPAVSTAVPAVGVALVGEDHFWTVDPDGVVTPHGDADHHGDLAGSPPEHDIVSLTATPSGQGYWLAADNGQVWAFGDAADLGDVSHLILQEPIVTMAATGTGNGFWLAASDGGMFTFGDAEFHGSAAIYDLAAPIVGMGRTSSDGGYWLAASDGGMFTFGDAGFFGSMGAVALDGDIVAMAATPDDDGYWLAGADGGIFTFGTASFDGSAVGQIVGTVSDMAAVGSGYILSFDPTPVLSPAGVDATTYYESLTSGQIAVWDALAHCESTSRWGINTGNGYFGGIQFSPPSWWAVGGEGLPHQHSRIEQIYRGALLQELQGWGAWPGCARHLGLI